MAIYYLINANNNIVSRINWNGVSEYTPPNGLTIVTKEVGDSLEWAAPEVRVPLTITRRQLIVQLLRSGIITSQEAIDAAKTGAVPSAVQNYFNTLSAQLKLEAEIAWASIDVYGRNSDLILALAAARNLTSTQVDNIFIAASRL
jgi:hypothetical protein